jgi:GT2 family glycosyltransferase
MKLSVILPCYNGADTLALQLDALAKQEWRGYWEVIVVNNGSTDASMIIVERYRDRLPNLRIVEAYHPPAPRLGVAHSYTIGLAAAQGDAFVFCESDDEVGANWLTALGDALQSYEFVACALEYSRLNEPWAVGPRWDQQTAARGLSTMSPPLFLPYASGCSFGLRRTVYEKLGNPDLACGAAWDTDYCWRAHFAGISVHFAPQAVLHYRLRHRLVDRYRQGKSWAKAHIALAKKYSESFTLARRAWYVLKGVRTTLKHALMLPFQAFGKRRFADWVWGYGWAVGWLVGSFVLLMELMSL